MALANSQIRIITRNLARTATLSAEPDVSNVASMPVTNMQNSNRTLSFRNTAVEVDDVITIHVELSERKPLSAIVLDGHNLKAGDIWRAKLYSGPENTGTETILEWTEALVPKTVGELDWGIDDLVATVFDNWDRAYSVLWFGVIGVQSIDIEIISEENPDGYVDINRLVFGLATSPSRNFTFGYELDYLDTSTLELTEGGSPKSEQGVLRRIIKTTLPRINDATERSTWADFLRSSGQYSEVFISLFPEQGGKRERDHSMVCVVINRSALKNRNATSHTIDITFQET